MTNGAANTSDTPQLDAREEIEAIRVGRRSPVRLTDIDRIRLERQPRRGVPTHPEEKK